MGEEPHTIPDHVAARIDRLVNEAEDMRQQASDDLKQIYADLREELRGMGWTGAVVSAEIAALKGAIQEMRLDDKEKAKREEKDERRGDYVSLLTRARARERVPVEAVRGILSQSFAEAKGRDAGSSSGRTAEFDSANAGSNPAPVTSGELTDTQEQPGEPATQSEQPSAPTVANEYAGTSSDENPAPISPSVAPPADTVAEPQAPQAATVPHSVAPPPPGETEKAEAGEESASAALSEAEIPAFLKPEQRKSIADYRPNCLNPDVCGATGLTHCYTCRKAMEAASETEMA